MRIENAREKLAVDDADLSGSSFHNVKLAAAAFCDADLSKASFEDVNLAGATFRDINFTAADIRDCDLTGLKIDGVPVAAALEMFARDGGAGATELATDALPETDGIRAYHDSDQAAVVALWKSVFNYAAAHNDPIASIRQKLRVDRDLFLVATTDGNVVGTVMGGYDGHRGWIYSLAVHPAHRRQGIAKALIRRVEQLLGGCLKVNLQLLASNVRTVAFYQKLGYDVEERISMGKKLIS